MKKKRAGRGSTVAEILAMTEEERDAMVAEFDREFVADTFGPPPPAVKAQLRRIQKRGRRGRS